MTSRLVKASVGMVLGGTLLALAQIALAQGNDEWTRPFPPFKLIGNIYWVGSYDLSTYLITTPQGHILINTGVGDTAEKVKASVEQLGFKMSDVKLLTATHGHFDHVAGMADLKKMTGASLVISERDRELLESGGRADFRFGDSPEARFEPVTVDRTFKDGETISLGGTTLTAHLHAGHTKGATSFTTDVRENGKTYRVIVANMGSINPGVKVTGMTTYPGIEQDYARTLRVAESHDHRRVARVARQPVPHAREVQARRRISAGPLRRSEGVPRGGAPVGAGLPRSGREGAGGEIVAPFHAEASRRQSIGNRHPLFPSRNRARPANGGRLQLRGPLLSSSLQG